MTIDCQHARQMLDAARPDRSDWDAPEQREAVAHVEECSQCGALLSARDRFDGRVAEAMQDLPIPDGLKDRLLAAIESDSDPDALSDRVAAPRSKRSGWVWITTTAAAIMIALGGWYLRGPIATPVPLDELFTQLEASLPPASAAEADDVRDEFDQWFDATPADPVWRDAVAIASPLGLDLDGNAGDEAAAFRFDARRVSGWLVVLPREQVESPPDAAQPSHAYQRYGPRTQVAWSRGDHVYVCVLERGTMNDLLREFYGGVA